MASKCIVCYENPAEVPDRNTMSLRKKVCRRCHAARLTGDLRHVLEVHAKRKASREDHSRTVCKACGAEAGDVRLEDDPVVIERAFSENSGG